MSSESPTTEGTQTFATEIIALSLTGELGGHSFALQESPTLQSMGEYNVTRT